MTDDVTKMTELSIDKRLRLNIWQPIRMAESLALQYLMSGRGWQNNIDRQPMPVANEPRETASTDAHAVATLPHSRHGFFPTTNNLPKSATATWGPINKNLMWKVTNQNKI